MRTLYAVLFKQYMKITRNATKFTCWMMILLCISASQVLASNSDLQSKYVTIPVHYLTDRQMIGDTYGPRRRYAENCQHRMYYGTAFVTVPNSEHRAQSALPTSLGWQLTDHKPPRISPKEKIISEPDSISFAELSEQSEGPKSTRIFLGQLEKALDSDNPQLAIFVHGAADGFEDCLQDAAILAYSLKKPMVLYSWPSDPRWRGYFIDGSNSEYSQEHFNMFCRELLVLKERHPFKAIFVAHSMGNRLVVRALPILSGTHISSSCELISPDIDTDTFRHYVMNAKGSSDAKIRLYVSNRDKMLPLSQLLAGGYYRLGEPAEVSHLTERQLKMARYTYFERIDFTTMDTGFYGHKLPSELIGGMVNDDVPPAGFKLVAQNSVKANRFARFANRAEKFKTTAAGLQPEFCKCVVRNDVKHDLK
ncbi:MAG: alpha/beta hydrolase [Candidatus Obscuribacterales bacterium]|nr:alpha/beta hydrolase [Candidatus Obscuribacterales bacterium]